MIKRIKSIAGNAIAAVLALMVLFLICAFFAVNYERLPK